MRLRLTGLVAALPTPMREDGSLDLDCIDPLVEFLVEEQLSGFYALGSTGEGLSLSSAERREVAERVITATAGRVPVLVNVGHHSVRDAADLARHAESAEADAISATVPSYFPIAGVGPIVDWLEQVAAAAPTTPFYYYHIPALTGVAVDAVDLVTAARERLPTLAGIKYTATALQDFVALVGRFGTDLDLLYGCDEMLLAGVASGAHGAIGSTYAFAAPLYRRVLDALDRGDLATARHEQARAVELVRVLIARGGGPAIKRVLGLADTRAVDVGGCRPPQRDLTPDERDALRADLATLGFFDWGRA